MRHPGTGLRVTMVAAAVAVIAAACVGQNTLRIVNRTQSPLLVDLSGSSVAVGACSERTVLLAMRAAIDDVDRTWLTESPPPGASLVSIPSQDIGRESDSGIPQQVVVVTQDYVGIWLGIATWSPVPVAGTGTFPPDPGSVQCAGAPPSATP